MNRDGKYGTIEMAVKPTAEQKKKLRSFINAVGGNVDIDFMDENYNTTHSVSYEGVSPARALSGITTFYDKGIKPEGNVSYSIGRYKKETVEKGFGGIWIADRQECAKCASAVKTTPHEEDGEGIAFTDNYFYAYYRNIDGQPIPFASVYMNRYESQDVVNKILKDIHDGEIRDVREWFSWFNEVTRNVQSENDAIVGIDKDSSSPRRNGKMGGKLSRIGSYYDRPDLYVKTSRTDINDYDEIETTNYSLNRTDIDYLDAVNRGDMATAQNDDIRYSINRDEVTVATDEMVAEANETLAEEPTLVEQLDEAQTALDRLRSKIDKRNQRKEMTRMVEVRRIFIITFNFIKLTFYCLTRVINQKIIRIFTELNGFCPK